MMLNNKEYTSKASVTRYVRENILSVYPHGQELNQDHFKFMIDLLHHHPSRDKKVGVGIKRMWIQRSRFGSAMEFWLERVDGSITDFSYIQCLTPSMPIKKIKQAMRKAIENFIIEFKRQHFDKFALRGICICPVLGIPITSGKDSHVDHIAPNDFDHIATEFIKDNIDINNPPITKNVDGLCGVEFTDNRLEQKWWAYHAGIAKLRVISAKANLGTCRRRK